MQTIVSAGKDVEEKKNKPLDITVESIKQYSQLKLLN